MPKTVKSPKKLLYPPDQPTAVGLYRWTGYEQNAAAYFSVEKRATGYWKRPRGFHRHIKNEGNQS